MVESGFVMAREGTEVGNENSGACPCLSGLGYADCCHPCHSGEIIAASAEQLMRSRYSAYVKEQTAYLLRTWHPSTRPEVIDLDGGLSWCGLTIISSAGGGPADDFGQVEFMATAKVGNRSVELHERSRFVREHGQWLYVDGEVSADEQSRPAKRTKVGRNAPCPCGSGQKAKRCGCGKSFAT